MQQEKANNNGSSKTTSDSTKFNGDHVEKVDLESKTQLSKHLEEEPRTFSSVNFEGSEATLVTVVSVSLLAGAETDKKLTHINEEEKISIAAEVSGNEGHGKHCKLFTLGPDTNDSDSI